MSTLVTSTAQIGTIKNAAGTNNAMTIDTSGRVNIPKIPAFQARGYGTFSSSVSPSVNGVTLGSAYDVIYDYTSVDVNRDNAFSNSTGIYTVPVAGLYHIQAGVGYKSSTNYLALLLFATSSDHAERGYLKTWANNDNNHTGRHMGGIVEASVGQEFALAMSDSYSNPNDTQISYLWFSAYMLG